MSTAKSRSRNYWPQITEAAEGRDALSVAWRWILSEIKQLDEHRPEDAEYARRHVATQLGHYAESIPKCKAPDKENAQ